MSELFPEELKRSLPKISDHEGSKDPIVYAVFQFPLSRWTWFATEADRYEDDICFFGYVVGLEREWGYFCLSELEAVEIDGIRILRYEDHVQSPLSQCLKQYGFSEK